MQKTVSIKPVSALNLLMQVFPGRIKLSTSDVAQACNLSAGSVRTMRCRGTFPIPLAAGGRNYDIRDVAAYLDAQRNLVAARGAPKKTERLEAARHNITVKELRARQSGACDRSL